MVTDDIRRMGHLMRRAGFGASVAELQQRSQKGLDATIHELLDGAQQGDDGKADWMLDVLIERDPMQRLRPQALRPWWLYRMVTTDQPLLEKMVLFWHGHFATSGSKVNNGDLMLQQNRFFRDNALGSWRDILKGVSRDPAMIQWLDNNTNFKAHANENYAREVMELFSLGIGNYTEDDIKQAARAFTGWTVQGGNFYFNAAQHDSGIKTFMGRSGNFDGDDIIDIILEQPAAAEFMVRKLFTYFAYESPEPAVVRSLASTFRQSNYSVRALVEAIFKSNAFWSARAWNTQIKSPTQLVVGTVRALGYGAALQPEGDTMMDGGSAVDFIGKGGTGKKGGKGQAKRLSRPGAGVALVGLAQTLKQMGQDLFYPPNVKGWDGGPVWINSATMMERVNFAVRMANTLKPQPGPGSLTALLGDAPISGVDATLEGLLANLGPIELPAKERAILASTVSSGGGPTLAGEGGLRGYQQMSRIRLTAALVMQSPQYQMC